MSVSRLEKMWLSQCLSGCERPTRKPKVLILLAQWLLSNSIAAMFLRPERESVYSGNYQLVYCAALWGGS